MRLTRQISPETVEGRGSQLIYRIEADLARMPGNVEG